MNYSPANASPLESAIPCISPKNPTSSTANSCAELYQRYAKKVYRKCLFILKNQALAEDATHDIFIKIYLHLEAYEARANITTWIYTIAYNHCLDILRKQRKQAIVPIQREFTSDLEAHKEAHQNKEQQLTDMQSALSKLKAKERNILLMKYRDGKTVQEIADKMHTTESAMKMRLKRAKERARCQMEALPS